MGGNNNSKLAEFEQDLSYLDITRVEMKMFYKVFCKIATEKDQEYVTVIEILKYVDIPYSFFAARALCCGFCYISAGESEETEHKMLAEYRFDYRTFVCTLWNFLTLCPEAFISFIFSIYDADGGGTIDPHEAQTLLTDLHGEDFGKNLDVIREYNKFAMLVRKNIDLERFQHFATSNPKIFLPAVELQNKLSSSIMGNLYWFVHTKKRKQLYLFNYKHVTRVVDKVRILREKELERDWESGGKGNKKYVLSALKSQQKNQNSKQEAPSADIHIEETKTYDSTPQNILVLDTADQSPTKKEKRRGFKSNNNVSFADDVNDYSSSPSPIKPMKKSTTSKYFFGTRPNTPSKQISYFLDKFYEKPGEVKVQAESSSPLTPYSLIKT
jgi:hypothetical protein